MLRLMPPLVAVALTLVACSNGSTNAASTTSAPTASAPAAPPAAASASAAPPPSATATATASAPAAAPPIPLTGAAFDGYTINAAPGATVTGTAASATVKTPGYQLAIHRAKPQDTAAKLKPFFPKDRAFKRFIVERDDGFAAEFKTKVFGMRWVKVSDQTLYVEISSSTEQGEIEGFEAAGTIAKK